MRFILTKLFFALLYAAPIVLLTLAACGGGSSGNGTPSSVVTPAFTLGGTTFGLTSDGLVLQYNGGSDLTVAPGTAQFAFTDKLNPGTDYSVSVWNNPSVPTPQTCSVTSGTGKMPAQDFLSVQVTCVDVALGSFILGGSASGLTSNGLVLQNNNGDDLPVPKNAAQFSFGSAVVAGTHYSVTVKTNPSTPISQLCTVSNGSGAMPAQNFASVSVTCVDNAFSIGGTTTGLTSSELILQNNLADDLTLSGAASGVVDFAFATKVVVGEPYSVTVKTNPSAPTSQLCTVLNGSGTMPTQDITNVSVTCANNSFFLGGTVTGLTGDGLYLQNNLADDLYVPAVSGVAGFTFVNKVNGGTDFNVTVKSNPAQQTCAVSTGSGVMPALDFAGVSISCGGATGSGSVILSGTILGLTGVGLVLQNNGSDILQILPRNGNTFSFITTLASGAAYTVTVLKNPVGQTCGPIANGSGTAGSGNPLVIQCNTP